MTAPNRPPLPDTDADDVLRMSLQPLVRSIGAHPSPSPRVDPEAVVATSPRGPDHAASPELGSVPTKTRPSATPPRTALFVGPVRRTPRRQERAFTVEVPPELRQALRLRAAQDGTTERVLVLRALRAFGLPVAEKDLIDRRQFNGARRVDAEDGH
jgi:hypothetical protein